MEHKTIGESTSRRTQDSPCLAFKHIQKLNQHHLHKTKDKPIQCSKGTVAMRALHASSLLLGVRTVYQVNSRPQWTRVPYRLQYYHPKFECWSLSPPVGCG
ncbi:hypothetical protein SLE2022_021120 [Rubroshorea leprosula]